MDDMTPQHGVFTFEQFWKLYPKKTGKKDCEKRYSKLSTAERIRIAETLPERVRTDENWKQGKFIPNPATYLNQGRWDDDYQKQEVKPAHKPAPTPGNSAGYGPDWCARCRSNKKTQRHHDICTVGVPYFDLKINGQAARLTTQSPTGWVPVK